MAAPLVVIASLWCHIIAMRQEKNAPKLGSKLLMPYLLAGLIAVPLGSYLLDVINAEAFRLALGLFLLLWTPVMLFHPPLKVL